ncbi:Fer-1-like protein 4 [Manis javanica]|nr:Fer-1-like protein 4 [Manis javanica]
MEKERPRSHTRAARNALVPFEDFLLFGVLFKTTMNDPAKASQPISFEISIGTVDHKAGHTGRQEEQLDRGPRVREEAEGAMAEAQPLLESESQEQLGTPAQWPEPMDGSGPGHTSPCPCVTTNHACDQGLQGVETPQCRPDPGAYARLKQALEELVAGSRGSWKLYLLSSIQKNEEQMVVCPGNLMEITGVGPFPSDKLPFPLLSYTLALPLSPAPFLHSCSN